MHIKVVALLLVALLISACVLPVKIYYTADGTQHEIDYIGAQWGTPVVEPTQEVVTPYPTLPTVTPSPECTLISPASGWINVRELPATTAGIIAKFENTQTLATGYWQANKDSLKWYQVWWFDDYGWIANVTSLTTSGNCGGVPFVNPF